MSAPHLVIYHSADADGECCREIARRNLGGYADYVGWNYGEPAPAVAGYELIYMLDCCVPELMHDDRLIWIDHHAPQIAKYPKSIKGYRIDGVAACRLTWQWFNDPLDTGLPQLADYVDRRVQEPVAVRLIGENDIWDHRDPQVAVFQHGLRSQPIDWPRLLRCDCPNALIYVAGLLHAGEHVGYASRQNAERFMAESSFTLEWEGLRWLAINGGPSMSSARYESAVRPEHDACLTWGWVPKIGAYKVSMRGVPHKPDLNLSAIALRHGGGGHRQACGFSARVLPWMPEAADTARLDWLEGHDASAVSDMGAGDGPSIWTIDWKVGNRNDLSLEAVAGESLRAAIDIARAKGGES